MGEPFTLKDMEATGDVARSLEQFVEKNVTYINGKVFKSLSGKEEDKLKFTCEEWQRFCSAFMYDEDVINDFNQLVIMASERDIDLNLDLDFRLKFLKYFRPQYEKKKRSYAQIIQLAGMGNLEPPKMKAEQRVKRLDVTGAYHD